MSIFLKFSLFCITTAAITAITEAVVKKTPEDLTNEDVTGDARFVCAMYRERNLIIDDQQMPKILTFCACAVVSTSWVLTAKTCYVQDEWYVSIIEKPFADQLPPDSNRFKIREVVDMEGQGFSLVQLNKYIPNAKPVKIASSKLGAVTTCKMYSFTTPDKKPIPISDKGAIIYKIWHMSGGVYGTRVKVLDHSSCEDKHPNKFLNPYKQKIDSSTLCVTQHENNYFEPCSFDRGAPIVCNDKLQGVLVYERELPPDVPLYLPTSCYGNIDWSYELYAEGFNDETIQWITDLYEEPIPVAEERVVEEKSSAISLIIYSTSSYCFAVVSLIVLFP